VVVGWTREGSRSTGSTWIGGREPHCPSSRQLKMAGDQLGQCPGVTGVTGLRPQVDLEIGNGVGTWEGLKRHRIY